MKQYIITEKSLAKAKRVLEKRFGFDVAFSAALDVLCVPQEPEGDRWVKCDESPSYQSYAKGHYRLNWLKPFCPQWRLYDIDANILMDQFHGDRDQFGLVKALADAEIKKHEAGQKPKQPKPFGPGTRLRAANGDELVVISFYGCLGCVNLTTNTFGPTGSWHEPEHLRLTLEEFGATVIEED